MNKKIFFLTLLLVSFALFSSEQGNNDRFENGIDTTSFSYQVITKVGQGVRYIWNTTKGCAYGVYQEVTNPKETAKELARILFTIAKGPYGKENEELIADIGKTYGNLK